MQGHPPVSMRSPTNSLVMPQMATSRRSWGGCPVTLWSSCTTRHQLGTCSFPPCALSGDTNCVRCGLTQM